VLFGLQVYWSSIFILLKKVLKDISQVFNRFLWNGGVEYNAKAKVAWKDVCFRKKEGGLGLKDLESWNTSAIMRHIWVMFARSGSLWVAWVQAYLLKEKSFWNVSTPQNGSWYWRKLLKFRHLARGLIRFEAGTGENIHLWIDNWHPFGALVEKFGFRIVYDSCSNLEAKLSSVLKDGIWCWRPAHSEDLVEIQTKLPEMHLGIVDSPVWTISRSGVYVSADTWNHFRIKRSCVNWWPLVWHSYSIHKQAFIIWLVFKNRLTTGDRMLAWGYKSDTACVFCWNGTKSKNHLFFGCRFCSRLWRTCMEWCNIPNPPNDWENILEEGYRSWKTKAMRMVLCKLVLSATVYKIWKARNAIRHGGQIKTEEQILKSIIWEVRYRVSGKRSFKKKLKNISLYLNWNIDVNVLV